MDATMSSVEQLTSQAMRHWAEYLPEKTADLKEAGTFEFRARQAAERAVKEIQDLVRRGMSEDEAEEMVLPEYILLKPEPRLL
ncbi:MAG: hypothetical protein LCH90_23670 [Proteobacteria bacterium]|nr:hypothetical protein [Pseudomonadota bacterium]